MKAVIRWTLWQRRWSMVWWSVGLCGILLLTMVFYPSFRDQAAELQKTFQGLPDAALQLVGGSADFFSPVGFLNSQIFFITLPALLGILAIGLGSSLLAHEEQNKTIESLLARPISRPRLLLAKAVSGVVVLSVVSLVGLVVTVVTAWAVHLEVSSWAIAGGFLTCFLLCLSFGALAFAVTALGKGRSAALSIAAAFAFGGYIISSLASTVHWLSFPAKFFAFHYYQPEAILRGTYGWIHTLFFGILLLVCIVVSWVTFKKRDLY